MSITFNGLASGLDTGSLIDQLVAAERSAANRLSTRQSDLNTQKSIVGSLSSALTSLATSVRGLDLISEVRPRAATVSDSKISIAASSAANAGVHDMRVTQLATTKQTKSTAFASAGPGVIGSGGVDITVAGVTKSVAWTSADSLDAIATRINEAKAGVNASVVFDGSVHRIVVSAENTGTAAAPTFTDTGAGLDLSNAANVIRPGTDAIVNVNGIPITRSSNVITDAITGMTITLNSTHAAADLASTVTVALDQKSLTEKLKAIVSSYNAVNSALHVQLDYTGTTKGANTLFGDTTLRQLQGSLGAAMSNSYGGSTLSTLGITRDKTGMMTLDETKLAAALATNPNAAADLFVTNSFATTVGTLADQYTQSGSGILAGKSQGLTDRHKNLQDQIDRINHAADSLQTRLEKQFRALEQAMSQLQSQSGYLAGLLR